MDISKKMKAMLKLNAMQSQQIKIQSCFHLIIQTTDIVQLDPALQLELLCRLGQKEVD